VVKGIENEGLLENFRFGGARYLVISFYLLVQKIQNGSQNTPKTSSYKVV
jgi:hypothetical protein